MKESNIPETVKTPRRKATTFCYIRNQVEKRKKRKEKKNQPKRNSKEGNLESQNLKSQKNSHAF